jgi:U3 small nucleolar RNA-associated protein 23
MRRDVCHSPRSDTLAPSTIRPRSQILLDGNFLATAERIKLEWRRLLPKLFEVGAELCHLHITECVLAELKAVGLEKAGAALEAAATVPVLKCRHKHGHTDDMDAGACIRALVGAGNSGKWLVATQDGGLRNDLRRVPGTPLLLISTNVLVLEPPSTASKDLAHKSEASKVELRPEEAAAVRAAARELAGNAPRGAGAGAGAGAGVGAGASAGAGAGAAPGSAPLVPARKKRKGPSEPNPLSTMKRKRPSSVPPGPGEGTTGGSADGDASTVRAKKHRRKHKKRDVGSSAATGAGAGVRVHDDSGSD